MNGILSQLGLISICAGLLYLIWKADRYVHEKYEDEITLRSDEEDDE